MPVTINGTTGISGDLTGNVTGSLTGTASAVANSAVSAAKLDGAQTGSAPIYGCRAWVNFNGGAGTTVSGEFRCTIRGSGNVSKVVRSANGIFLVTFITAMPDANYAAQCTIKAVDDTARHFDFVSVRPDSSSIVRITCSDPSFNALNPSVVMLAIFG